MTKQLPPDFPESMTGFELINQWGAVAHEAGFKWPEDWQTSPRFTDSNELRDWGLLPTLNTNRFYIDSYYRINPDRLKPKAPVVLKHPTVNTEECYVYLSSNYIQIDDRVRRRLGKDAGVDTKNLTHVITTCRNVNLSSKDITSIIMELIEAAAVEVKE